jgi:hypothetical protein
MLRNDEDKRGLSCRTKGHIDQDAFGKGNFLLQYFESMLWSIVRMSTRNFKGVVTKRGWNTIEQA